jgi:hypothetical protein
MFPYLFRESSREPQVQGETIEMAAETGKSVIKLSAGQRRSEHTGSHRSDGH